MIFDLDETLVFTRAVVLDSYRQAGVVITDDEWSAVWGKPWRSWLHRYVDDPRAVHAAKTDIYTKAISDGAVTLTPLGEMVKHFNAPKKILTGASAESAIAVCDAVGLNVSLACGLTYNEKIKKLRDYPPGVYFDDDLVMIDYVQLLLKKWKAVHVAW
jgi:hypothetical protein